MTETFSLWAEAAKANPDALARFASDLRDWCLHGVQRPPFVVSPQEMALWEAYEADTRAAHAKWVAKRAARAEDKAKRAKRKVERQRKRAGRT